MRACKFLYCVRCASSTSKKMLFDFSMYWRLFSALSNLLITVVITAELSDSIRLSKFSPEVALITSVPQFLNVSYICLSKSLRSVTSTTRAFLMLQSGSYFESSTIPCASITIERDLPDPCVCHTRPPLRLPSLSMLRIRFNAEWTTKNC